MIESILKWLVYLGVVAAVLNIGWKEPLRYRFMSPQEIADELPKPPPPTPKPVFRPSATRLDRF